MCPHWDYWTQIFMSPETLNNKLIKNSWNHWKQQNHLFILKNSSKKVRHLITFCILGLATAFLFSSDLASGNLKWRWKQKWNQYCLIFTFFYILTKMRSEVSMSIFPYLHNVKKWHYGNLDILLHDMEKAWTNVDRKQFGKVSEMGTHSQTVLSWP